MGFIDSPRVFTHIWPFLDIPNMAFSRYGKRGQIPYSVGSIAVGIGDALFVNESFLETSLLGYVGKPVFRVFPSFPIIGSGQSFHGPS